MSDRAITDVEIVDVMISHGGSFVAALAKAWQLADPINRMTIRTSFPAYWRQFREVAELKYHQGTTR